MQTIFSIVLCAFIAFIRAIPEVQNQVQEILEQEGQGIFLVTFKPADVSKATSPLALSELKKGMEKLTGISVDDIVSDSYYRKIQGNFVYETLEDHHISTKVPFMELKLANLNRKC